MEWRGWKQLSGPLFAGCCMTPCPKRAHYRSPTGGYYCSGHAAEKMAATPEQAQPRLVVTTPGIGPEFCTRCGADSGNPHEEGCRGES